MNRNQEFPMYRRSPNSGEVYQIRTATEILSIRNNIVVGVGISNGLPAPMFALMHDEWPVITEDEFIEELKKILDRLRAWYPVGRQKMI
jgi:hypothetical protein